MAARRRDLAKHRNYGLLREYKATLVTRERLSRLGAHGAGIGRKEVGGQRTDTLALLFYVARKQPVAQLSAERIPESVTFFSRKAQREFRLPTDVIETPPVQFEQDPETRIRPVPGGVSFGIAGSTGTLGGWVWDETDDTIVGLLRAVSAAAARPARGLPPPPAARLRRLASARRFHAGIARDMQARLATTRRGRLLTGFVDEHRFELTTLLLQDGDLRRAMIAALRPIVAGATTTTDVLERAFSAQDLERLDAVARELSRRGSEELQESLEPVLALGSRAEGKTSAEILGIEL
jgi:hypothetical protein